MGFPLWLAIVGLLTVCASAQREGSISGTVYDNEGVPVADAHVSAAVMQGGEQILTVLTTDTNELGGFLFSHLNLGEYRVAAEKQEAGYVSTSPDIFTCKPPSTIVLSEQSPTVDTSVRFMPKGATITGWVKDSNTGKTIPAHLSLSPIAECGWSTTGTSGEFKFRLLVPADTPIKFGACAEGYKAWFHADSSNPTRPLALELRPGALFEIEIRLERSLEQEKPLCSAGRY